MPNKQAQKKQPKIPINVRIPQKANENKSKYAMFFNLKTDTEIIEHTFLNAVPFFLEQSTSKPLEQPPSKASIPQMPENCKSCPLHGVLVQIKGQWKMMCILKEENKQPNIEYHELVEAEICSTKPIYISKATQKEYESRIETLQIQLERAEENEDRLQRKDDYYKELRKILIQKDQDIKSLESYEEKLERELREAKRKLEPMQDLLTERDRLKCRLSGVENEMKNGLLERDEKIAILETDNEQLRKTVEELSHDTLVEINKDVTHQLEEAKQLLKVQQAQADNSINDYKIEIKKLEALNQRQRQTLNDVISQIGKALIDFKQFIPTSLESYDIQQYIIAMRKKIEMLEGYLHTISI